jgi:hypothetical protein
MIQKSKTKPSCGRLSHEIRLTDLFIRLCVQNKGTLSANKRKGFFAKLTDDEIARMHNAVRETYFTE